MSVKKEPEVMMHCLTGALRLKPGNTMRSSQNDQVKPPKKGQQTAADDGDNSTAKPESDE